MRSHLRRVLGLGALLAAGAIQAAASECPTVVRVSFDDPERVSEVTCWVEPWEVHLDEGYLIVDVYRDGLETLHDLGFSVEVDVERTRRLCTPRVPLPGQKSGLPGLPCYRTMEETHQVVQDMLAQHPNLVEWIDIGDSWEKIHGGDPGFDGHDLMVLRLTNRDVTGTGTPNAPQSKPVLFAIAGIHARECPPQEVVLRLAEHLVYGHGHDADATWLLDEHEIHLMLNGNPDGRQRAQELVWWRKNANNNHCTDSDRRGVDLNRNFEWEWGPYACTTTDPCHEVFRGSFAGSEPETQAIEDYLRSIFPLQLAHGPEEELTGVFFDLHAYGHWLSWPWFYSRHESVNHTAMQTFGRKLAYHNGYSPQPPNGSCGGVAIDYAYGLTGAVAYLVELGSHFYEDCEVFEGSTSPNNLEALIYAAKVARAPFVTPAGPDVTSIELLPYAAVRAGDLVEIRATANDSRFNNSYGDEPVERIVAVEMTLDQPHWSADAPEPIPLQAIDGYFSSTEEQASVQLDTSDLELGRHTLFLRAKDASGRWGAVSAAFLWITERDMRPRQAGGRVGPPGHP